MDSRRFRNIAFLVHSWLGLHIFLVFGLIFLTGTLLVFITEIDTFANSTRQSEDPNAYERASLGQMFDSLQAAGKADQVLEIRRSGVSWIADRARARNYQSFYWLDPGSGNLRGQSPRTDIRRIIFEMHTTFMTDKAWAAKLVTLFSIPFILFIVTGLISYRRFWKGYFRLPPRHQGARGWWGGVHRLAMLWVLPFIMLMALTSFYYLLAEFGLAVGEAHHEPPLATERATLIPEGFDGAALDRIVAVAQAAIPGLQPELVGFPAKRSAPILIAGPGPALLSGPHGQVAFVDPVTFKVLEINGVQSESLSNRIAQINQELHYGTWGGLTSRLLWLLFGIIGTLGMVAGALTYAARLAPPDGTGPGAFLRLWRTMSVLRWILPLWLLGMVAVTASRYGPF
ncbi:MAG: PepSY-associated TM helix domain-containing protein [Paracoccaceae bacterium]